MCVGMKFAMVEGTIFLAMCVKQYKLSLPDHALPYERCWNLVFGPKNPVELCIERR